MNDIDLVLETYIFAFFILAYLKKEKKVKINDIPEKFYRKHY